jgi:hypothetical protein
VELSIGPRVSTIGGCTLYFVISGFKPYISDFMDIIQHILEILANIGGYWALFEARYWEEVGRWLPTLDLYNQAFLRPWEEVQNRFMLLDF